MMCPRAVLMLTILLFAITQFLVTVHTMISYSGYVLLQITPRTEAQLQYILKVNSNTSNGMDFWLRTTSVNRSADVMAAPSVKEQFIRDLRQKGIHYRILLQDVGEAIEDDDANTDCASEDDFFCQYNSYSEIVQFMLELSEKYPRLVCAENIGESYENLPLMLFKISTTGGLMGLNKPAIWIQSGQHSREMIGPPTVAYIAQQLVLRAFRDRGVAELVDKFDWYILPVLNPDGYEYARTEDRLWRKTRSCHTDDCECVGVDANRNWGLKWSDSKGSSRNPCSGNYAGPRAFSEPETEAVAEYMKRNLKGKLLVFMDFHSYSQKWLTPWGYTSKPAPNYEEQKRLAEVGTKALREVYGTVYSVGSSGGSFYTVSGGARDWVYGVIGAQYSYVVELRDLDHFGFVLPKAQIFPNSIETWECVKAMACDLLQQRRTPAGQNSSSQTPAPDNLQHGFAIYWRT